MKTRQTTREAKFHKLKSIHNWGKQNHHRSIPRSNHHRMKQPLHGATSQEATFTWNIKHINQHLHQTSHETTLKQEPHYASITWSKHQMQQIADAKITRVATKKQPWCNHCMTQPSDESTEQKRANMQSNEATSRREKRYWTSSIWQPTRRNLTHVKSAQKTISGSLTWCTLERLDSSKYHITTWY